MNPAGHASDPPSPDNGPDYSQSGVDLGLIRWMLSLTPRQRLQFLEERISDILEIRERNATR